MIRRGLGLPALPGLQDLTHVMNRVISVCKNSVLKAEFAGRLSDALFVPFPEDLQRLINVVRNSSRRPFKISTSKEVFTGKEVFLEAFDALRVNPRSVPHLPREARDKIRRGRRSC